MDFMLEEELLVPTGYLYVEKKYLLLSDHQLQQQLCVSCGIGWSRLQLQLGFR